MTSRPGRSARRRCGRLRLACVVALALGAAAPGAAQVEGSAEVRDGRASVLVRNPTADVLRIEVAVRESDETVRPIRLGGPARANVWPPAFELPPGETQVVRITVPEDAYPAGTVLRLETRMLPVSPTTGGDTGGQARARVILATRILSKLIVR